MENIKLLDCTLRDGGYINDWLFGRDVVNDIIHRMERTNIDVLEIGFLKNEEYNEDRTVFNSMEQVKSIIAPKRKNIKYAVMCEVVSPLPLDKLEPHDGCGADIIRVIVWKTKRDSHGNIVDALKEGFDYCKGIVDKGYQLCVQPARVDQYSDEEFVEMVKMFATLNPLALYVVDSWGTQTTNSLLHYMRLLDETLDKATAIGYHGHNNMLQAYGVAQALIEERFEREIFIDASVYGIGRGAGNLNLEIIAKHMNDNYKTSYDIEPMIEINDLYIRDIFAKESWGYSVPYYLTASYNCNPNYARYYESKGLCNNQIKQLLSSMDETEKVMFSPSIAENVYTRKFGTE